MKRDQNIRVLTISELKVEIMYSCHREGTRNLLSPKESRESLEMALEEWKIRVMRARKIGRGKYVLAENEKIRRITMPLGGNQLLYVTKEVACAHSLLIERIHKL